MERGERRGRVGARDRAAPGGERRREPRQELSQPRRGISEDLLAGPPGAPLDAIGEPVERAAVRAGELAARGGEPGREDVGVARRRGRARDRVEVGPQRGGDRAREPRRERGERRREPDGRVGERARGLAVLRIGGPPERLLGVGEPGERQDPRTGLGRSVEDLGVEPHVGHPPGEVPGMMIDAAGPGKSADPGRPERSRSAKEIAPARIRTAPVRPRAQLEAERGRRRLGSERPPFALSVAARSAAKSKGERGPRRLRSGRRRTPTGTGGRACRSFPRTRGT